MNNIQDLIKKYPIYKLDWGFECDNGWYNMLDALSAAITKLDGHEHVKVVQVKEKFGTLRFYYHIGLGLDDPVKWQALSKKIDEYVLQAELLSARTCEQCGAPGTMTTGGWMKVLCEQHKEHK